MFLISNPKLVIAQCTAGVAGIFPSLNARPQSQLKVWIQEIKAGIAAYKHAHPTAIVAPFGVNLVALDSQKRLEQDLATCVQEQVPIIVTSMRAPRDVVEAVHSYGGLHFHDVVSCRHAEKAIEAGVDGLILVTQGAGGHAGTLNPFAFVAAVRNFYSGTIALAGCLYTGKDVLAAQLMGADLAYIGTGFIATHEAQAEHAYKDMIVSAHAEDIIYTPEFTGVNANILKQSIQQAGINPQTVAEPSRKKPSKLMMMWKHWRMKRIKRWKDIWSAGQGVEKITAIRSVKEYVEDLIQTYNNAKNKQ